MLVLAAAVLALMSCPFCDALLQGSNEASKQTADSSATDELSARLSALSAAKNSNDSGTVGSASKRVLAVALARLAKASVDRHRYDDAIRLLEESLAYEDSVQTQLDLAVANLYAKKLPDALKHASDATEREPDNALAWKLKGEVLLKNSGPNVRASDAVDALLRAVRLRPDADTFYSLGVAYLKTNDLRAADESFSRMLSLAGDAAWSRSLIGRAYEEQRRFPEAAEQFKKALQLEPRALGVNYQWALSTMKAADWNPTPETVSLLRDELILNPRHFQANYVLGICESIQRSYAESDRHLLVAASLNTAIPEIFFYLGKNANEQGRLLDAERYFRRSIRLYEKSPNLGTRSTMRRAYFLLGRLLVTSGRKVQAEPLLQTARKLQAEDLNQRRDELASMQSDERTGIVGAAEPDLKDIAPTQSEAADPAAPYKLSAKMNSSEQRLRLILASAFDDLATSEAMSGEFSSALLHYQEASAWDANLPGLRRNLALASAYAGHSADAVPILKRLLATSPADSQVRSALIRCYFAMARFQHVVQIASPIEKEAGNDPELGYFLAKAFAETKRIQDSAHLLARLESRNVPVAVSELLLHADLWQELGNEKRATELFQQVLALEPGNVAANCALGRQACPAVPQSK